MRRTLRILTATAVLVVTAGATALAGGITVVTFDEVPAQFQAGTSHSLSFSILSHGKEPIDAGPMSVRFQGPDGETLTFEARQEDGRYTAEVTLPTPGQWSWVVAGDFVRQELGTVSVAPPDAISGLLTALWVGLPIATLLAVVLLIAQVSPVLRVSRRRAPVSDVV
jgi:hypothetical protein